VVQTAAEALEQIRQCPVDVILIDVHLPQAVVLPFTQQLTHDFPHVRVVLLGVTETDTTIQAYVEAGAIGYVLKTTPFHELQAVIELAIRGETLCPPHIAYTMFARLSELAQTATSRMRHEPMILSDRELEILQLIAKGWSNRQIADHLYLSSHTVKNHVHNILKKLRVQRRLEAIKYASDQQWFTPGAHVCARDAGAVLPQE
jgi:DNA-binding NarL/FixJ family response regulator